MTYTYRRPDVGGVRALVLDWAGTTVDHGSLAPVRALERLFAEAGLTVADADLRSGMGLHKRDHIGTVLALPHVASQWRSRHGRQPERADAAALYEAFLPLQLQVLAAHAEPIAGALEAVDEARRRGLAIGSTTGYTRPMMDVLLPAAREHGYEPDACVTPDEVPAGRPAPWMCFANASALGWFPMSASVKVGDTVPDVEEGLNAGMWTVAVAATGNEPGLSAAEAAALPAADLAARVAVARARLLAAGAHFAIDRLGDLSAVLDTIDGLLAQGERP